MTRFLTLNQFVNTWECDENDHLNVQFYYSKFDDAGLIFATCHKLEPVLGSRISRHVRYHGELRSGEQVRILSSVVTPTGSDALPERGIYVQHIMESVSGRLAATALDWHRGRAPDKPEICDVLEPAALPRGLIKEPDFDLKMPLEPDQTIISRGVLSPAQCDGHGRSRDQGYVGAVSDASPHVWAGVGLSNDWLAGQGFGRVVAEMRLVVHEPMRAGDLYETQIAFTGVQSRAFTMRHDFFNLRDRRHIGFVESVAMLLDKTSRRSSPLPDFAKEAIEAAIA